MNRLCSKFTPLALAGLGVVGFFLRKGLYAVALDHKNLLLEGHPLQWLLFLVTAFAIAMAALYGMGTEPGNAPHSGKVAAIGSIALAGGILMALLPEGFAVGGLSRMRNVLGILAALAMMAGAVQQLRGQKVFFLFPGIVCVFFAVHMVSCYQGWSSNPQILDYLYTLLASVGLMLFAYQQTACAADCGSGKLMRLFGSFSIFCGITALSGTEYPAMYLAGSFWVLTALCCPEAPSIPREEESSPEETE